jgi:hypothetical protein
MFPFRFELGFYIPEDGILHRHRSEHLKSYILHSDLSVSVIPMTLLGNGGLRNCRISVQLSEIHWY